ncbi:MAG: hypothetical protein FMNOHCHN_03429 [Ignavibacteriaceae bacterium]|nr:hypothetical protein [Ignavibacteriaceae bacterium]
MNAFSCKCRKLNRLKHRNVFCKKCQTRSVLYGHSEWVRVYFEVLRRYRKYKNLLFPSDGQLEYRVFCLKKSFDKNV